MQLTHKNTAVGQELKQMCEWVKGSRLLPEQDAFNSPPGEKTSPSCSPSCGGGGFETSLVR